MGSNKPPATTCQYQLDRGIHHRTLLAGLTAGCQFDVSQNELHDYAGQRWCMFHLPEAAKAKWEPQLKDKFRVALLSVIRHAQEKSTLLDLSGTVFPGQIEIGSAAEVLVLPRTLLIGCVFTEDARIENVLFAQEVYFDKTIFRGQALMSDNTFRGDAHFNDVDMGPNISLSGGKFEANAYFQSAGFPSNVWCGDISFAGRAWFQNAILGGIVYFNDCRFGGEVDFGVNRPDDTTTAFPEITFEDSVFEDRVSFVNRIFSSSTSFANATFHVAPEFHGCRLHQDTDFSGTLFLDKGDAKRSVICGVAPRPVDAARAYRTLKVAMENARNLEDEARFASLEQASLRKPGKTIQVMQASRTPGDGLLVTSGRVLGQYDVAIICALRTPELTMVLDAADTPWKELPADRSDPMTYHHGEYTSARGTHLRLVASAPSQMGMPAAAVLATKMILRFRPRLVAMVGIAAGAKSNQQGYGDILAPNRTFDYNAGKLTMRGDKPHFEPDFAPIRISERLHSRLDHWRAKRIGLDEISQQWPVAKQRTRLAIHVGPLGSGAQVIDARQPVLDVLEHWRKLIGIEMEAYGVHLACASTVEPPPEFLCLKSVCDFATEKANDWQDYAAYTAAQVCHRFLKEEWENLFPDLVEPAKGM